MSRAGRRLQPSATAAGHLAATTRLVPKDGAVGGTCLTRSRSRGAPIRQQAACPTPEAVGAPPAQAAVPPAGLSATPAEGSVEAPPSRTPASPAWRSTLPPVAPAWCPGDRWHEGGRQPVRPAPASGSTAHGPAPPPLADAQRGEGKHQSAVPPRLALPPGAEGGQRRGRAPATPPVPTPVVVQRSRPRVQPPRAPSATPAAALGNRFAALALADGEEDEEDPMSTLSRAGNRHPAKPHAGGAMHSSLVRPPACSPLSRPATAKPAKAALTAAPGHGASNKAKGAAVPSSRAGLPRATPSPRGGGALGPRPPATQRRPGVELRPPQASPKSRARPAPPRLHSPSPPPPPPPPPPSPSHRRSLPQANAAGRSREPSSARMAAVQCWETRRRCAPGVRNQHAKHSCMQRHQVVKTKIR